MYKFAGFVDFDSDRVREKQRLHFLTLMGKQLSCGDADEKQYFDDGRLSLVVKCLSVIDPKEDRQPVLSKDKTRLVVVDGRIYNHRDLRSQLQCKYEFGTNSDAEIILHLYDAFGSKALKDLNGMFAILIWDAQRQELFLARDRLGIKSLYYCHVGSQLIFGSNLKSLLVHPNAPNHPQWLDLAVFNPASSYVKGIYQLSGGHYLTYSTKQQTVTPQCYWEIGDYFITEPVNDPRTSQDCIREYRFLFADSVKKCLMSDVAVGAFLSGGIDSSSVVAVASQARKDLHCFTILESYTLEDGDAKASRQLCEHLNLPFHPVFFDREKLLEKLDFSLETFEYFVWLIDSPKFEIEWLFKHELHRYARTLIPDLKVMFLGQGADEFTGGYSNPEDQPSQSWETYTARQAESEQPLSPERRQILMSNAQTRAYLSHFLEKHQSKTKRYKPFQKEMFARFASLQAYNLWHEDRSSSSQSVEVHFPFLDRYLVEYLAAIPPQLHAQLFWDKTILREMAREWLPDNFVYRRKSHRSPPKSLYQLREKILLAIFPAFQEKYLETGNSLFSKAKILSWLTEVNVYSDAGMQTMRKLLNAMAMTVFQHLCYTRCQEIALARYQGQSPLEEFHSF